MIYAWIARGMPFEGYTAYCLRDRVIVGRLALRLVTTGWLPRLITANRLGGAHMMVNLDERHIAGNPDTPIEVIRRLCKADSPAVRERVASNPTTPPDMLAILAADSEAYVRVAVAENSSLPHATAVLLCDDAHPDVRLNLAGNIKISEELIRRLTQDDNPYVADAATKTLDIIAFEALLKAENFQHESGELARLGDLLVASAWLAEDLLSQSLKESSSQHIPLGQLLLRCGLVPPHVIATALKLQSSIRRGQISITAAIERLAEQRLRMNAA
jgi:hypothetical protein